MSELGLSLTAIAIFTTTALALVGPMLGSSPLLPAGLGFSLLVLFSLDAVTWQGRGATLLLDGIQQRSPEYRQRILHHEAGHYLVATLESPRGPPILESFKKAIRQDGLLLPGSSFIYLNFPP